jgi:hypothetical protein
VGWLDGRIQGHFLASSRNSLLQGKGLVRFGCGGVRNHADLSGAAYASPYPDKAPLPE